MVVKPSSDRVSSFTPTRICMVVKPSNERVSIPSGFTPTKICMVVKHLLLMFVLTLISSSQLLLIYSLMVAGETVLLNGMTAAKAKEELQTK